MDIVIGFSNPNTAADGIRVYRSLSFINVNSLPAVYDTIAGNATSYTDSAVVKDTQYFYVFEAYKGADKTFSANIKATAIAYSGPGPQILKGGDLSAGYYGIVTAADFISWDGFIGWAGISLSAKSTTVAQDWLKFAYKGKTLFISQQPIGTYIWRDLYTNGLVYGTNDVGPREYNTYTATNQLRTLNVGGSMFKARIMNALPPGLPLTTTLSTLNTATVTGPVASTVLPDGQDTNVDFTGSEWNDLFLRTMTWTPPSQRGRNWDRLDNQLALNAATNYVGMVSDHLFQEFMSNSQIATRGVMSSSTYCPGRVGTLGPTTAVSYRPVLEML